MKKIFLLLVIPALLALLINACGSKSPTNPSATTTPTPTPTITNTPCGWPSITCTPTPRIEWYNGGFSNYGLNWVRLRVDSVPETTAGVTLVDLGPTGSNTYTYPYNSPFVSGGGVTFAEYDAAVSVVYNAGDTYALSSNTSAGVASVTLLAAGGGTTVTSDGITVTWNHNGTYDSVNVYDISWNWIFGSPTTVQSPYYVPVTVYSAPGTYHVYTQLEYFSNITNASGQALSKEVKDMLIVH